MYLLSSILNNLVDAFFEIVKCILDNNKYSQVEVSFNVTEVDPYDAETVLEKGSFRGMSSTFEKRLGKL